MWFINISDPNYYANMGKSIVAIAYNPVHDQQINEKFFAYKIVFDWL